MCGIAGYRGRIAIDESRIDTCLTAMRRRGPDNAAHRRWHGPDGTITDLLFTRLSIIDLDERANQPLGSGSRWMVCNGELYNYRELRQKLDAMGDRFGSESDVEVFVHWLDRFGLDGLDDCEGMWAFALYDEATGDLALGRDRFGEKPLYVLRHATGLYFGSEVKFIATLLGQRLDVNLEHVRRYLVNGFRALYKNGETFFRGLTELAPATCETFMTGGREAVRRYWQLQFAPDPGMSYSDAVSAARNALIRSVELRLRSDVPLAFCMSGGVDSNTLVAIAKRVFDYDVHGFTIVNHDARYNEQDLVSRSVEELGIRHTAIPVNTADFLPRLRMLVRQHDAPVYTISYYAHFLLMEGMAAQGYRIAVSGTAADELFSGYYDHHLAYLYDVRDTALHAPALDAWSRHVQPYVRNPHLRRADLFVEDAGFRDHIFLDADAFAAFMTSRFREEFEEAQFAQSLLRNRMLNELFHEIVPVILHEDDLNAMFFSVENRSPFLDRALAEVCYRIPTEHLIRGGRAKAVLRDAMRGVVPDAVLDSHRKVGFNAPIFSFLDSANPDVKAEMLADSPIFDLVERKAVAELLDEQDLRNSQSKFVFYFLSAKMFLEEFA